MFAINQTDQNYSSQQVQQITPLPPRSDLMTNRVWSSLNKSTRALANLNGRADKIPNPNILLSTLWLQEATASSAIENIVTTQDELFNAEAKETQRSPEAKEVWRYRDAMRLGYNQLKEKGGITSNMLIAMYRQIKQRSDGFRKAPGTIVKNATTGEVIYTPPQSAIEIVEYMDALVSFANDEVPCDLDPLVKMALIHHQFESIHPFIDGNGRVGRILNVLYLMHAGLLDSPILYLSREIKRTKDRYYELLQKVRTQGQWENWIVYMLEAVSEASRLTAEQVESIYDLMREYKKTMRNIGRIYSHDLLNNLFVHPYTRIELVAKDLSVSRPTATSYLKQLASAGLVTEVKAGRNNYYVNEQLLELLRTVTRDD